MIVMSHAVGNANVRQAALALAEAGRLAEFWTGVSWTPGHPAERWLPAGVVRELRRRSFPEPVRARLRTVPGRETVRLLAGRLGQRLPGGGWLTRHETGWASVDGVWRGLDRAVARRLPKLSPGRARGVYAYEDGALETFRAAASLGWKRFYDLPTGYWRANREIFAEEAERQPEWAATLVGHRDSPAKLARKDAELALADEIIVASTFTQRTLALAPSPLAPVRVIPYGAPTPLSEADVDRADDGRRRDAPLRVLFAGGLGQHKGIAYLLEAVRQLGSQVELTLLGTKPARDCAPLERAVQTHRWVPTLPHAQVLEEMARQDVLVFPSLFEGFGLVILEAMSRGLPVVATPNGAGPDVIDDGADGFIVPIRDALAIAEKLELLRREPERRRAMRRAARAKAAAFTWEAYRRRLLAAVDHPLPAEGQLLPC